MRVAITNPYCWPQRRRGSERLLHDLAHWLAARGHDVTIIATAPGKRLERQEGLVRQILLPQRDPLGLHTRWCNFYHRFSFQLEDEIVRGGYDAVHCLNYHDAWGVVRARRRGARPRLVYQMVGIAMKRYFRSIPHDGLMFEAALRGADLIVSVSRSGREALAKEFGAASVLLPSPTHLSPYLATPKPVHEKGLRILFVADLTERRKGALLLARAFAEVVQVRPDASLTYSGDCDSSIVAAIRAAVPPETADAITFLGVGELEDLPRLYANATLFVNPSVWEAQGMVLVEALAAGTPIVGCKHGGIPDILSDPAIGRLFEPDRILRRAATNVAGLVQAILETAQLAAQPQTEARCRAHAQPFGWHRLGPAYEQALLGSPVDITH